MGRPFQEKYTNVQWESNSEQFEAWRSGRTGVPIVDAAVRQANTMGTIFCHHRKVISYLTQNPTTTGWMHNRARMIAAMYLTKDLMIDWRLGERVSHLLYFHSKPLQADPFSRITAFHAAVHRWGSRLE